MFLFCLATGVYFFLNKMPSSMVLMTDMLTTLSNTIDWNCISSCVVGFIGFSAVFCTDVLHLLYLKREGIYNNMKSQ